MACFIKWSNHIPDRGKWSNHVPDRGYIIYFILFRQVQVLHISYIYELDI